MASFDVEVPDDTGSVLKTKRMPFLPLDVESKPRGVTSSTAVTPWQRKEAHALAMLLGVGFLMPWAACNNSLPYYRTHAFANSNLAFRVNVAYSMPFLPMPLILLYIGSKPFAYTFYRWSIPIGYAVLFVVMAAVPFATDIWLFTILTGFMPGLLSNVIQTSLFALNSAVSPDLNGAVWTGQGVAGLTASALQIVVGASIGDSSRVGTLVYFSIAAAMSLLCAVAFIVYQRHPYIRAQTVAAEAEERLDAAPSAPDWSDGGADAPPLPTALDATSASLNDAGEGTLLAARDDETARVAWLLPRLWDLWLVLALNFAATFLLVPVIFHIPYVGGVAPVAALMPDADPTHQWWSTTLFALFNVGDTAAFVARQMGAAIPGCGPQPHALLTVTVVRVALCVLAMPLLARGDFGAANDVLAALMMLVYAFTNGFIESSAMMYAEHERGVHSQAAKRYMGNINGLCIVGGLFVGGALSYAFTLVV